MVAPPGAKNKGPKQDEVKKSLPLVKSLAGRKDMVDHDRVKVSLDNGVFILIKTKVRAVNLTNKCLFLSEQFD